MDTFKRLINELLTNPDKYESQSFKINENGDLEYGAYDVAIQIAGDEYIVETQTHDYCNGSHVDCITVVEVTTDANEALEMAVTR